ncbi:MAG: hypothetical protein L7W43_00890 [Rubripirellula sp.]|nr:hypothetical protein [Rubripirellula sp.]
MMNAEMVETTHVATSDAGNRIIRTALVLLMVIGIATVAVSQNPTPQNDELPINSELSDLKLAETVARVGASGDMIGFSHSDSSGTQTITLVHTGKAWMAVYHIDRSGKVRLVSSRPIDADFSLQLNATSPLPDEIREINRR